MAKTYSIGKRLNPVSSAVTGGLIPEANVVIQIDSWADELEPRRTPILSKTKKGKAVDQIKLEWGQSYHTPVTGSVGEALDDSELPVTLASGEGKYMQKWMVLEIIDWADAAKTRLDYSTREQVWITDDPDGTDTIKVKRGYGTSAVAHADGAFWGVVGVAMPYNSDFTLSPFTRGDRLYNLPQRFFGMVGADQAARNTPSYEYDGDQFLKDFKTETMRQKFFLERALVSGQRYAATNVSESSSAEANTFGGIDYYLTNHSGRVVNLGGRTISAYDFEDVMRDQYKEIDDGGAKTFLMGVDTAAVFDSLLNPIRQATVSDSSINLVTDTMKFRWGTVEIMPTQHLPEGRILMVDMKDISIHPYKGCDWQTKTLSTDGPYHKQAIWGEFTVKVDRPQRMGIIHNFSIDLNNYSRREFF